MAEETTIAKLRNELSPLYGLSSAILALADVEECKKQELIEIILRQALQAEKSKEQIRLLLSKLEEEYAVFTQK